MAGPLRHSFALGVLCLASGPLWLESSSSTTAVTRSPLVQTTRSATFRPKVLRMALSDAVSSADSGRGMSYEQHTRGNFFLPSVKINTESAPRQTACRKQPGSP